MESWKEGTLFPKVYQQTLETLESTTSMPFQHPYKKGIIRVNVVDYKTQWRNDWRGGAVIDITVKETIDDKISNQIANPVKPEWNDPILLASKIDNQILNLPKPASTSFLGIPIQNINAFTAAMLTSMLAITNSPIFFAETVQNIQALAEAPATIAGTFVQNVTHCIFVCKKIGLLIDGVLQQPAHPIVIYISTVPVTLTHLTGLLSNTLDQLLQLNPQYASSAFIPANNAVRYYDLSV